MPKLIRAIRIRDIAYGLAGAFLGAATCFIAGLVYPGLPVTIILVGAIVGFLAGFFFGATAIGVLFDLLGVV